MSRYLLSLLVVFFVTAPAYAQATRPAAARAQHAVIISVDGMRADLALRAEMPNLRKLMAAGSYSFWARSTEMSVTLPTHATMVTGVVPDKHGLKFNDDGPAEPVYPAAPSIFELAKQAGYSTAMATGKSKLGLLARPGSVDWAEVPPRGKGGNDDTATGAAVGFIQSHRPGVLFLHLTESDGTGHGKGWGSPEHIRVLEHADACIGQVLEALREAGILDSTLILVTADHGGRGKWHGAGDPRARHIPWIAVGPGIRQGYDLDSTDDAEQQVDVQDTFATACTMLGITPPAGIDGQMVWRILQTPPAQQQEAAAAPSPAAATTQPAALPAVP